MARELHDIVSHAISVVVIHTQAVRRRLGPEHTRERDDLAGVEATARQAMAEMRRLFGVLRSDYSSPSLTPQPGVDQLDRLIGDTRNAGQTIDCRVEGQPVPLPPGIDVAAYRIVQEALTNVRKHAPGAAATVVLRYQSRDLHIIVEDDGPGASAGLRQRGHGLLGMKERVTVFGGSLEVGDRPIGGFRVAATLPLRDGAQG